MPSRLAGRVVLVTGAAGGLGRALARCFAARGARLALLDVDARVLEASRAALATLRVEALALPCDVRDAAACARAVAEVVRAFGGIDVLVNNAGISHHSRFEETELDVLRRVMEVNFFGAVHCTRAALASVIERRGAIVAISSIAGFSPLVERSGYTASKHALHGLFDTLRAELAERGVSVLVVCPGFIDTAIDAHALAGDGSAFRGEKRVVGRRAPPDEVALAIVRAVERRRSRLVLSGVGKAAWWLSRLAPATYARMMRARQRRE